jgi:peroxiredoxin
MDPFTISYIVLWLLVLFQLLLTFALIRRIDTQAKTLSEGVASGLTLGTQVPDFTAHTLAGEPITLADQTGKTTVYVVVSPDCKPCKQLLPSINNLGNSRKPPNHQMMIVSLGDKARTEELVTELQLDLPMAIAPREENSFMVDFKLQGTPTFLLVDAQGKLRASGYPSDDSPEWKKATDLWRSR